MIAAAQRTTMRVVTAALLLLGAGVFSAHIRHPIDGDINRGWRETDVGGIARNFSREGMHLFYPQIDWRGNGPGYVEGEFPLYPYLIAIGYRTIGFHEQIGRVISYLLTLTTLYFLLRLAAFVLPPEAAVTGVVMTGCVRRGPTHQSLGYRHPARTADADRVRRRRLCLRAVARRRSVVVVRVGTRGHGPGDPGQVARSAPGIRVRVPHALATGLVGVSPAPSVDFRGSRRDTGRRMVCPRARVLGSVRQLLWPVQSSASGRVRVIHVERIPEENSRHRYHLRVERSRAPHRTRRACTRSLANRVRIRAAVVRGRAALLPGHRRDECRRVGRVLSRGVGPPIALLIGGAAANAWSGWRTLDQRARAWAIAFGTSVFAAAAATQRFVGWGSRAVLTAAVVGVAGRGAAERFGWLPGRGQPGIGTPASVSIASVGTIACTCLVTLLSNARQTAHEAHPTDYVALYDAAHQFAPLLPPGVLIAASGGPCQPREESAGNEPWFFYWTDHKGFNLCADSQTVAGVNNLAARGARYFIGERQTMAAAPGFEADLRSHFPVLSETPVAIMVRLDSAATIRPPSPR